MTSVVWGRWWLPGRPPPQGETGGGPKPPWLAVVWGSIERPSSVGWGAHTGEQLTGHC